MLKILKKMFTQKELEEQERALVIYTVLIMNGFMYLIIMILLSTSVEGDLVKPSFFIFLTVLALCTALGIMVAKNTLQQKSEISQGIIRLSIVHVPVLLSFTYWIVDFFELM